MIRVGFVVLTSDEWTGGIYYFKNPLFAITKIKNRKFQPVLFFGKMADKKQLIHSNLMVKS